LILELLSTTIRLAQRDSNCSRRTKTFPLASVAKPPCARSNASSCLQLVSIQCPWTLQDIRKFVDSSSPLQNSLRLNFLHFLHLRSFVQPRSMVFKSFQTCFDLLQDDCCKRACAALRSLVRPCSTFYSCFPQFAVYTNPIRVRYSLRNSHFRRHRGTFHPSVEIACFSTFATLRSLAQVCPAVFRRFEVLSNLIRLVTRRLLLFFYRKVRRIAN